MSEFKSDDEKDRWDLIPLSALRYVVKAFTYGSRKYDDWSWRDRVNNPIPRYYAATMRHLDKWQSGERNDPETGLPHLAHAIASLLIVMCHSENVSPPVWIDGGQKGGDGVEV